MTQDYFYAKWTRLKQVNMLSAGYEINKLTCRGLRVASRICKWCDTPHQKHQTTHPPPKQVSDATHLAKIPNHFLPPPKQTHLRVVNQRGSLSAFGKNQHFDRNAQFWPKLTSFGKKISQDLSAERPSFYQNTFFRSLSALSVAFGFRPKLQISKPPLSVSARTLSVDHR